MAYIATFGNRGPKIRFANQRLGETRTIVIPRVFSLLDEPEAALKTLEEIRQVASIRSVHLIRFDHRKCEKIGLCASTAMDLILLNAVESRRGLNRLAFSGWLSKVPAVNLMLRASGILQHLGLPESRLTPEDEGRVRRYHLYRGKQRNIEVGKERDVAATDLTDYFNSCLQGLRHELTPRGKSYLSSLLSEVIGNAEEHGGPWSMIGHWEYSESEGKRFGECHIVILNAGNTIYESLDRKSNSPVLKGQLKQLSDVHRNQGFFAFIGPAWDEETLWTLYALQERVSRYVGTPRGKDRGNGTVSFIEFFQKLAAQGSGKMCIASGHAYILFNGKYHLREVPWGEQSLRIIAFNADNDLYRPPDRDCVYRLEHSYPGTLVSIRLTLDESYLAELASAGGER